MPTFGTTAKYALRRLTGSNPVQDIDAGFQALAEDIDGKMVGYSEGPIDSRPMSTGGTPGIAGREYFATDTGQLFKDRGTSWVEIGTSASQLIVPTGTILATGRATASSGYLMCEGQAVSRSTYAALFTALTDEGGTRPFGEGNGSTTFNVPDLRGRMVVGKDDAGMRINVAPFLGQSGGEEEHTLTEAELPSHDHTSEVTAHGLQGGSTFSLLIYAPGGSHVGDSYAEFAGGGGAHNNMPPYQVVNYMIKT